MDLASDQLMKRFDRPEGPLFYAEAGQADAPVLLCLHGFPESWLAFEAVMPLLAEKFRVIAPDQRGYSRSFKPEGVEAYQTRHLAADMLAIIDHVVARPCRFTCWVMTGVRPPPMPWRFASRSVLQR